jgi:hypothetical protein
MNSIDDSTLQAYVDGELDAGATASVDRALRADSALAQRVQALHQQRDALRAAFADIDDEVLPPALQQAAQRLAVGLAGGGAGGAGGAGGEAAPPPAAPVHSLDAARAERAARAPASAAVAPAQRAQRAWAPWWGMAASVMLGLALGFGLGRGDGPAGGDLAFDARSGSLLARGAVAQALGTALASAPDAAAPVAVQLSFIDRSGAYCRTFSTGQLAGLACREGGRHWAVQHLAAAEAAPAGTLRQAATALPPELLAAVDRRAAGAPLDAAAERAARDRGWQR